MSAVHAHLHAINWTLCLPGILVALPASKGPGMYHHLRLSGILCMHMACHVYHCSCRLAFPWHVLLHQSYAPHLFASILMHSNSCHASLDSVSCLLSRFFLKWRLPSDRPVSPFAMWIQQQLLSPSALRLYCSADNAAYTEATVCRLSRKQRRIRCVVIWILFALLALFYTVRLRLAFCLPEEKPKAWLAATTSVSNAMPSSSA